MDEAIVQLKQRVRFEGDTAPPFWQADVWYRKNDYHATGSTPQEALARVARFWELRKELDNETT